MRPGRKTLQVFTAPESSKSRGRFQAGEMINIAVAKEGDRGPYVHCQLRENRYGVTFKLFPC